MHGGDEQRCEQSVAQPKAVTHTTPFAFCEHEISLVETACFLILLPWQQTQQQLLLVSVCARVCVTCTMPTTLTYVFTCTLCVVGGCQMKAAAAPFAMPKVAVNATGWGPTDVPAKFAHVPYD